MKGGKTYPRDIQLSDPLDKTGVTSPATMTSSFTTTGTGEKDEKTQEFDDEYKRLKKEIKALKKEIDALKKSIAIQDKEIQNLENGKSKMESQNQKQTETIRTLKSSYDKLQKELEDIRRDRDQLQTEMVKKTSKLLSPENESLAKKLETLTKDFEAVKKENMELKRRLEELTKTCEKFERKEKRLALGQVSWLMEKEIWKAVLPDEEPGTYGIFKSMEEWLEENKSSTEGIAAQKRWDDLKYQLNWKELSWRKKNHRKALYLLKEIRKGVAHPIEVDLEVARQQLKDGDYVAEWQKESCTDIIDMLKMLTNLNSQSKVSPCEQAK